MANRKVQIQDFLKDAHFVQWVIRPTPSSDAYWKKWMAEHPDKVKTARLARETILSFQYQDQHQLPTDTYSGILDTLISHQHHVHSRSDKRKQWFVPVAASLLLLLLGGALYWHRQPFQSPAPPSTSALTVKRTQQGEKLTVHLSDGTQVQLNSNTVLTYPAKFDLASRHLQLTGEAFFQVAKDPDRPFVITSGGVETTVLGTTFNVRAFDDEPEVQVALVEGKVKLKGGHDSEVFLSPNEVGRYQKKDSLLAVRPQNVQDMVAWSQGVLLFDNDTESQVWKKLEDWYGVTIIVQRKPSIEGKYSGRYSNEALTRVLDGISYAAEFDYEIVENNRVIIK